VTHRCVTRSASDPAFSLSRKGLRKNGGHDWDFTVFQRPVFIVLDRLGIIVLDHATTVFQRYLWIALDRLGHLFLDHTARASVG
jgi:hypothetical protein